MYDYYFGEPEEIFENEINFLLSVKRMLPKWCNSISDSQFISLYKLLDETSKSASEAGNKFVIAETGLGASSIVYVFWALKCNGIVYSWDYNGEKGSHLRSVCTENFSNVFKKNVSDHWKHVAYNSLSPYLGIPILDELEDHVDFFYHDSTHVLDTLIAEMSNVKHLLRNGSIVAMDDAYFDYRHTDTGYVNILRKKLGLSAIPPIEGNTTRPFYSEVEEFLKRHFNDVKSVADHYKSICNNDLFWKYFSNELDYKKNIGGERADRFENRFACWKVGSSK